MKYFLIVFVFASLFSCAEKNPMSDNPLDYISDTTTISIDPKTEPYTRVIQYLNGDLYWWNPNRESISVIDLSTNQVKNTIKMERNGPNGLGKPLVFFVLNPDSIYVPTMAYKISLINSQGLWQADYDYFDYSPFGEMVASMSRYSNLIQNNNQGVLYLNLPSLQYVAPPDLNEDALNKYPPILSFNLFQGSFEIPKFRVPLAILEHKDFINFGLTITSNSLLLLHNQSNNFLEVEFNGIDYKEHNLQSELLENFSNEYFNSPRDFLSIEENMKGLYKTATNFGISYDPHRQLLYRFGWPGEEIPKDVDPMQFSSTPPYFTISIYEGADFSLIKEFTLPRNTYLAHHYFVNEKGLNLFPMHPENPAFNEDEMVIHTFDFSGLK